MVSQQRLFRSILLLLALSLLLVACERPIPGSGGDEDTPAETTEEGTPDPNVGGGLPGDAGSETTPPEQPAAESAEGETPRVEEEATPTSEAEPAAATQDETVTDVPQDEPAADDAQEVPGDGDTQDTSDGNTAATDTGDTTAGDSSDSGQTSSPRPATHTVAAGENLYRIGLQYTISWVTLANFNNLSNPNRLTVGQILNIPTDDTPQPVPTESPSTDTTYTVRAGDNLFRIGLRFNVSWIQIAEANGIVNPNQVFIGQTIKIPVSTPGPTPPFMHQVRRGETLFLISLRYGVPWPAIAGENDLNSPYVIFPGQILTIPSTGN